MPSANDIRRAKRLDRRPLTEQLGDWFAEAVTSPLMPTISLRDVDLKKPFPHQKKFVRSKKKRRLVRGGRRGGKTTGLAIVSVKAFLDGRRVLYAVPTLDQLDTFWFEVTEALWPYIEDGTYMMRKQQHIIELPHTKQRIRAKTAWNADTLRGDYADFLILDEAHLMAEDAWDRVGLPMLLDNNGTAILVYTPPSLTSRSSSKAKDKLWLSKLEKRLRESKDPRWDLFHFKSEDNPRVSKKALAEISKDMTMVARRQELGAELMDASPGALWARDTIEKFRRMRAPKEMDVIAVAIDPSATSAGDEAGIVGGGRKGEDQYILEDSSLQGPPEAWAKAAITMYHKLNANTIVAESNNGGEMVSTVIKQIDPSVPVKLVHASRGKYTRAEPVAVQYTEGHVHHVGTFENLEDEQCLWVPGDPSPNRMDALVWLVTHLTSGGKPQVF